GLALGVSLALKATLLLFVPVVLVRELRRKNHKAVLCVISGAFLILTPFSIRNYLVHNTFSPWPLNGGINFFIGNNPSANGSYLSLQNIPDAPIGQSSAALLRAEEESGRKFTMASSNRYWFKQGISFIKTRPLEAAALLLRKMRLFWYHREIPGNVNIYFSKPLVPLLNWPLLTFGMLAPLSILGIYTACRRHNSGTRLCLAFLLSSLVSVVVFFISSRHRLSAVPLLCCFAALAGQSLFNRANRTPPFLRSCALVLTAGIILVFFPLREMNPRSVFWVSHVNIGNRLIEQGDYAQAAGHYQKAASLSPSTPSVQFQLANAYFLMDRFDDAERVYQRALELNPDYVAAHFNLALYYHFHKKDRRRALYHYLLAVSKGLPPQADFENDLFTDPPPSAAAPLAHDHKGGDHPEDDHGLSDRQ
ncbi:MAG: tetratricopeptide repeat protein, partial [Candidatus Omnitrophica bacterium]|nr:tetratricopeptide repeat protein [Candidatus Omnitrophota bacterium]